MVGGGCRVGGRFFNGASSPRVSLARTSLRTRYCCPRLLGSTWSRMSPSRRPPAHASCCGQFVQRSFGVPRSVPSSRVRHHGSTPPRKQCTPAPHGGLGVLSRHLVNSGPDFRSSSVPI